MQKLILLALIVIIVLLAPWTLGLFAAAFSVWALIAIIAGACFVIGMLWLNYSSDPDREQKRLEKRIQRITQEANRANARKD
ncbi:hypothetical protein [Pseudomonas sp. DG56-2]|uniref:hypothetical protein n=1 Tax=Pseudomonas sp. DG56-2 TaxID=2320270 RepID=UPI000FA0C82A|nr:hypothetical protein [Pseudomonas sp. DG56-2]